tara:strand:+ start:135 stop:632 length:498 start_codon:yes stop_codon:yes gene_type:complete
MPSKIYRYNFSKEFIETLSLFAKKHRYDDLPVFKEEWNRWVSTNLTLIESETRNLIQNGYEGDVSLKMFKSARYYFKNKTTNKPKTRRKYVSMSGEFITSIDNYISGIKSSCSPHNAYENYCNENNSIIISEIETLLSNGLDKNDISAKIKKTFKNRYFLAKNVS